MKMIKNQYASTKLGADELINNNLIRKKIENLKKEIKKYTTSRISELYKILNEIVKLKKALPENKGAGKRYTFRSLEWEKDLNITASQIRYIESYKWISSYAKTMVDKGLIDDTTVCHFLSLTILFREEKYQNKMIDMVIAKKIRIAEISELTKEEIKLLLEGKLKKRIDEKYVFSATKSIRSILKRLKDRGNVIKKSPYYDNLIHAVNNLQKYLENVK